MRDKCCSNFSCLSRLICLILLTQPQLIYAGEFTESQWADCLAVPQPLAAIAARAESKRLIIVTAVSAGYIPATVNWLAFMERLDIRNILLIAMDETSRNFFASRGFHVYLIRPFSDVWLKIEKGRTHWVRMHVWFERMRVVYQLLALKYAVLHSDADALWLKNPLTELKVLSRNQDLIFSRGNAAGGANAGHGRGVCMGFFLAMPRPATRATMRAMLIAMKARNTPDQPAMNSVLWPNGKGRSPDSINPRYWFATDPASNAKFVLLPQSRFARHAGARLAEMPGLDIHVIHPTDEGYMMTFAQFDSPLPRAISNVTAGPNDTIKSHCNVGGWFEKIAFGKGSQVILKCAGLWLIDRYYDPIGKRQTVWPAVNSSGNPIEFLEATTLLRRTLRPKPSYRPDLHELSGVID